MSSITVPPGAFNHGYSDLLCFPPAWTDYFIFFATNYVAHAATLITHPGETFRETGIASANALFIPGSGALRAFRFLILYLSPRLSGGKGHSNPLGQAARAGALCMLVESKMINEALWETEGTLRLFFGEHIRVVPSDREIFGICRLPPPGIDAPKYVLVEVPLHMPLRAYGQRLMRVGSDDDDSDSDSGPEPDVQLARNYNISKILISILQIVWGVITLYQTRRNQIALYGFGAFGLTVAPYAIMSIVNLAINLLRPEYATMYLVHSPAMEAAAAHHGFFQGMVASVDVDRMPAGAADVRPEDFTGGLSSFRDNLVQNCLEMLGYLLSALLPITLVGAYTGFRSGSDVHIAISWIMGWLIIGSVSSLWVRFANANAAASHVHPLWEVILVLPLWIPAMGGFVVVAQMLKDFGMCLSF
ncbi:hypothetical protein LZ554_008162 [Drepanopeziza brunnea f. sp. 'monogermtubi']|nr:hypothetical protein LZ554_008162 [Drepanopeziza brunnea f. sp. 'monogermtubi']